MLNSLFNQVLVQSSLLYLIDLIVLKSFLADLMFQFLNKLSCYFGVLNK